MAPTRTANGDAVLELADGRRLAYREFGAPDGQPLVALHGTPGSRLKFTIADEIARARGLRMIAPDRWGYGATDPRPRPSLTAYAHDVAALADHLRLERFAVMGVSGGGPYAAAVAAELAPRVTALALAAPVGPIAGEADTEITAFHRFCFGALAHRPATVGAVFQVFRGVLGVAPSLGMRMAMLRVASADRHVLGQPDVRDRLGATFVEGLRPGVAGPVCDLGLFGRVWNVDLAQIAAPSRMWLGTTDQNVPLSAARRLASRVTGCELVELPGEGHLWIANNYGTVLDWIGDQQKGAAEATPQSGQIE